MRRREFLGALGGAVTTWPLAARAQQPAMPVIGYLGAGSSESDAVRLTAIRRGLSDTGFVEGRNVAIEYRWAQGQYDRLPALAAELVRRQPAVLIAAPTPVAVAAKAATRTVPTVFFSGGDPVALGLVASLSRPGGNITGVTILSVEVGQKLLELLHESVPATNVIVLLVNPANPLAETQSKDAQAAASTLGLQLHVLHASTELELQTAFDTLVRLRAALVIGADAFFTGRTDQLATLALRHGVPSIYNLREFAMAGGLMSYGGNLAEAYRLVGAYAARILKGEKVSDLPVQQSAKVEVIINLKTARALGITIPLPLLGRADEVIE